MGTEEARRFTLQVEMQCRCIGCVKKVEKAMASIGSLRGIETSVGDVDTGIVTVVGKVDPTEVCQWLKKKTKKSVKVVNPDPAIENHNQKMVVVLGSSSRAWYTTPSAPPLQDEMSWALAPPVGQHDHKSLQLIEEKIRGLEKVRDVLKIKNLENELIAAKSELTQSRKVINSSKKALLDSALNQLKAYKNLEALSQSPYD
ncbi:hypothetical protein PAHAL_2G357100 [Panicum hallii]|uniref:HMA domain-containing protein n=1 Tax=Panicum hallii TaxID=206008 RepID=A0A2S3H1W6_9POAL|nr:heavy metal-associated isoprenylated plant protein 5-like [Panicum hallii]PAN13686.1 hypothetical protein PAHAL_2G357100 [Panicum hallii]